MSLMEFMSFDINWFKTLPGILLVVGCLLLVVAIILIPVMSKKEKQGDETYLKEGAELVKEEGEKKDSILKKPLFAKENKEVAPETQVAAPSNPAPVVNNITPEVNTPLVNTPVIPAENLTPTMNAMPSNGFPEVKKANENLNVSNINLEMPAIEPAVSQVSTPVEPTTPIVEEPVLPAVQMPVINNEPVDNNKINLREPEVITVPKIEDNTSKEPFGGASILPPDFKVEEVQKREAFGGEKILPDNFDINNNAAFKEEPTYPEVPPVINLDKVEMVQPKKEAVEILDI